MKGSLSAFRDCGFFVSRSPLLGFGELFSAEEHPDTSRRLAQLLARDDVREALWLGSPDLFATAFDSQGRLREDVTAKARRALYRYVARMAGRPTPFGLFAGLSIGKISASTSLAVPPGAGYGRTTRLDMGFLADVAESAEHAHRGRPTNCLHVNNTAVNFGESVHFIAGSREGERHQYDLVKVECDTCLHGLLDRTAGGASREELALFLVETHGVSSSEAEEYLDQLLDSKLLVSEWQLSLTGEDPTNSLIDQLNAVGDGARASVLDAVRERLRALDARGVGQDPQQYVEIATALASLGVESRLGRLFQVDLRKEGEPTISSGVVGDLLRGLEILRSIAPGRADAFDTFKQQFIAKYGGDQEIPLLEVLDEARGIGFERSNSPEADVLPVLKGIRMGLKPPDGPCTERDAYLLNRVLLLAREGSQELLLTAKDLAALRADQGLPVPDAFSIVASLAKFEGDARHTVVFEYAHGPSGAALLGRFSCASRELADLISQHLRAEEALSPQAIHAELVHLPEGRTGNVIFRPVLREFEIPIAGRSGAPPDRQIPLEELTLSVVSNRVVLRWGRTGREVLPRLTSAHHYSSGHQLKLYTFLCRLQSQQVFGGIRWDWGWLGRATDLPRVRIDNLVLSLARWLVTSDELGPLVSAGDAGAFQQWRQRRQIPRFVVVADGDNRLPLDLHDSLALEVLIEAIKKSPLTALEEAYPAPEGLCAREGERLFTHQLVVPFVRKETSAVATRDLNPLRPSHSSRGIERFGPGSEWLFLKLYTPPSRGDALIQGLRAVLAELVKRQVVTQWFFIRYGDPEWHIRLRLRGKAEELWEEAGRVVLPALNREVERGSLDKIQCDTYERETRRYGGADCIDLAEEIFWHDSECAGELIACFGTNDDDNDEHRWLALAHGIDELLHLWGLDRAASGALMLQTHDALATELNLSNQGRKILFERFRDWRPRIEAILRRDPAAPTAVSRSYERWSTAIGPLLSGLKTRALQNGGADVSIISSLVHMHVNRVLTSSHRAQEMALYGFLGKAYVSIEKREARPLGALTQDAR